MERQETVGTAATSPDWVNAVQGAALLGVTLNCFRNRAKQRDITRQLYKGRLYYSRAEVKSWADFLTLRSDWHKKRRRKKRWTEIIDLEIAVKTFIPAIEAAGMLDVSLSTLHGMVARGRMWCYQTLEPGGRRKLWFSRRACELLREDAAYQEGRRRYAKARQTAELREQNGPPRTPKEARELPPPFREGWLTAREAALRLGVGRARMYTLGIVGRLEGVKMNGRHGGKPTWCFRESAVEALKAEPGYQKLRARQQYANTPERREERAVARQLAAAEWTMRINGWDDPEHEFTYQACPSNGW